jgi:hypothetical protein
MFWRKSEAKIVDEMIAAVVAVDSTSAVVGGRLWENHSGVIRDVIAELRRDRLVGLSPVALIGLILQIVDLIQTVGPVVREIVERIRQSRKQR